MSQGIVNIGKAVLKAILPDVLLNWHRGVKRRTRQRQNSRLDAKQVFTNIYLNREWGDRGDSFCSGSGSDDEVTREYVQFVRGFIQQHEIRSVVDLGCGDFRVGAQIQIPGAEYLGVDIVDAVVARNNAHFGREGCGFRSLDIVEDGLPPADLCLIRQVLQHLSNDQVSRILRKLGQYRFVLVTEHHPSPNRAVVPNRDKPHGGDTRVMDDSAVFLDQPPFLLRNISLVLAVPARPVLVAHGEMIKTFLICNEQPDRATSPASSGC